jgi:LEA14-like dessication related protein
MKWITKLVLLFSVFTLTSCFDIPEFRGVSNFKLDEFKGNHISFQLDVDVFNPNGYGIRVRPSVFDVYINNQYVGKGKLDKSFKMRRKKNTVCHLPISLDLERGIMLKLIRWAQSGKVDLRVDGDLKVRVAGIPKKEKIEQTQEINLKDLNINFGELLGM